AQASRHVAIVEAEHAAIRARDWHDELIVEPLIEHHLGHVRRPETGRAMPHEHAACHGQGRSLTVEVRGPEGDPAEGVDLFAVLGGDDGRRQLAGRTDADGCARFDHDPALVVEELAVVPPHSFWPLVVERPTERSFVTLVPLPDAVSGTGWWHRDAGFAAYDPGAGAGIRIGVIDSGIGAHPALAHVADLGAIVDCVALPDHGHDDRGHGTHVCGAIGARIDDERHHGGLAPASNLVSLRVFGDDGSAHQADIALALHAMAHEHDRQLVNLSLGAAQRSQLVADAVADADAHGCLVACAVGNTRGSVEYPAALGATIAVTAYGRLGCAPPGSLAEHRRPADGTWRADPYFIAEFCCHGPGIDLAAPGVGIISTVPGGGWAAYGGTSMAAPQFTGCLAARLATDPRYPADQRSKERSAHARRIALRHCFDLGLAGDLQGRGRLRG
ncbi:MAG: S8 family serine peptidase, partial [Wenzhouxiangellaceae bacterium]|nr:S8 family serine peptidase [Wenzhouxiangellaceae bacterium]